MEGNSIEEGDLYAHTFGEKEPRGRVRMLGTGPTPQSVGAPGTKAKLPTKLAMQIQLRRRVEQEVSTLKERMQAMNYASMRCSTPCFHKEVTVLKRPHIHLLILSLDPW